jgi:hypothetical protein
VITLYVSFESLFCSCLVYCVLYLWIVLLASTNPILIPSWWIGNLNLMWLHFHFWLYIKCIYLGFCCIHSDLRLSVFLLCSVFVNCAFSINKSNKITPKTSIVTKNIRIRINKGRERTPRHEKKKHRKLPNKEQTKKLCYENSL